MVFDSEGAMVASESNHVTVTQRVYMVEPLPRPCQALSCFTIVSNLDGILSQVW